MMNIRLFAAVLLMVLAGPAMAASRGEYHDAQTAYRAVHSSAAAHRMSAQDFNHFDFGIAHPIYHSGWGGPYGDGDYPGTVDQNMGPPYWSR